MKTMRSGWGIAVFVAAGCTSPPGGSGSDDGSSEGAAASDGAGDDGGSGDAPDGGDAAGDDAADGDDAAETGDDAADDGGSDAGDDGPADDTGEPTEPGPDFRELGPYRFEVAGGTEMVSAGCAMSYDHYTVVGVDDAPTVVLAHGFMGTRATMETWASHLASWGIAVVAPDLCHATIADADHAANGAELVALADQLGLSAHAYAGYSAGGLAAVLAASSDAETAALVGLDMVDSGGLGVPAAANVSAPALGLLGEPSTCNETNNGVEVFGAIRNATLIGVVASDHCDFQNPVDGLCGLVCPMPEGAIDDADIADTIVGITTGFMLWRLGLDDTGEQWVGAGGHWYDVLSDAGFVD